LFHLLDLAAQAPDCLMIVPQSSQRSRRNLLGAQPRMFRANPRPSGPLLAQSLRLVLQSARCALLEKRENGDRGNDACERPPQTFAK